MLSVPIAIDRVNKENITDHVNECKRCHVDRVFVCLFAGFMEPVEKLKEQLVRFVEFRDELRANGIEVGIWVDSFGHGAADIGYADVTKRYRTMEGVFSRSKDSFCPLDADFQADYNAYIRLIAESGPDLIMLDDDFRFSGRNYGIGCFCKLHRKALYQKTGKRYSKLRLFNKLYSGTGGALRTAWQEVLGDSLISFARALRSTVDSVNEGIRMGCCMCLDTLDFSGVDAMTLARTFAGKTKPFFRTIGAPYWQAVGGWGDARSVAEYTRQQMAWFDGEDVEVFAEGDVYPRPRYVVPASYLQCYDAYLHADARGGILKYMFDYNYEFGYERGYLDRHVADMQLIEDIAEAFKGKKQVGVQLFEPMHMFATWDVDRRFPPQNDILPPPPKGKLQRALDSLIRRPYYLVSDYIQKFSLLPTCSLGRAQRLFSLGMPTVYTPSDGVVVCFGESARSLPDSYLDRGVILDSRAARILSERGIDVGFVSAERCYDDKEKFSFGTDLFVKKNSFARSLVCSQRAEIVSTYQPSGKVASYFYTNEHGQSFYVLGVDGFFLPLRGQNCYFNNYYRQRALVETVERLNGAPLVATCCGNIDLTLLCARGTDGEYALGLFNFCVDDVISPKVKVSIPVQSVRGIGCTAKIVGDNIEIEGRIPPYGFCAILIR